MIKVPANPAGMPAIEMLISEGINLNVTLVFSLAHYENVAEAYLTGLEKLAAQGKDVSRLASAASFFISRVNSAADNRLADLGNTSLQGKIGMANAKAAYGRFHQIFNGERWNALARKGARLQRPPASTARDNRGHRQPRPPGPAWIRCGAF